MVVGGRVDWVVMVAALTILVVPLITSVVPLITWVVGATTVVVGESVSVTSSVVASRVVGPTVVPGTVEVTVIMLARPVIGIALPTPDDVYGVGMGSVAVSGGDPP